MRRFAGVGRTAKVKSGGFGPKTYFVSFCAGFFTATLENEAPSTRYRGGEGNGCRRGGETVETRDERRVPESPTEYTLLLCASERGGGGARGKKAGSDANKPSRPECTFAGEGIRTDVNDRALRN